MYKEKETATEERSAEMYVLLGGWGGEWLNQFYSIEISP